MTRKMNIHLFRGETQNKKKMALETMASLSCLLSSFAPASLNPSTRSSSCTLPSSTCARPSQQQLSVTRTSLFLEANRDDVIDRVAYPWLGKANLVFFKSGYYNVEVVPKEGESEEQLVNDFKRSVFRAGVLHESRRRRFFESSQEKRKRKTKEAAKKYRKRRPNVKPKPHSTPQTPKSLSNASTEAEDDDNWELPPEEIEIPYTNRS